MIFPSYFTIARSIRATVVGLVALAGLNATPVHGDAVKILPVDEAEQDAEFLVFRDDLLAAVRRRDVNAAVAAAVEDIKLSFGGDYGRARFRELLVADDNGAGGSYWEELELVLELGGVFTHEEQFCAPYIFCAECPDCYIYTTLVALSDRAPVYSAPAASAPVVTHLSYCVVTIINEDNYPWLEVELWDGWTGFVRLSDFRSMADYRAFFEKREGRLQMRIFIAGD